MTDETISSHPIQRDRTTFPYSHMVWFAIGYGFIVFVCTVSFFATTLSSFPSARVIMVTSIVFATIVLSAVWAVFGPGGYLKRVACAQGLALLVVLGLVLGLVIGYWVGLFSQTDLTSFMELDGVFRVLGVIAFGIPGVAMASQLPFLFLRLFFGWQFVWGDAEPAKPFSLRDIFAVTFLFALSFASPQLALNLIKPVREYDSTFDYQMVTQPDGTELYEQVALTDPKEIEDRRRILVQEARQSVMIAFASTAIYVFVESLLCIPIVLFVFRSKNWARGFLFTSLYMLFWVFLYVGGVVLFEGGPVGPETVGFLGFWFISLGAAIFIPLAVSRSRGFCLTSPARYNRKRLAAGRVVEGDSGSDGLSSGGDGGQMENIPFGGSDDSKSGAIQQMSESPENESNEE